MFAAALAAGCAADNADDKGAAEAGPAGGTIVDVTAREYAFEVPSEVSGGLIRFQFENVGELPHEFGLARIDEGTTADHVTSSIEDESWPPAGVHNISGGAGLSPGESFSLTETLQPGSYVFTCWVFPDASGTPHASLGMYKVFTVSGESGATETPPDAVITESADGFDVPALATGPQLVEYDNAATGSREAIFAAFDKDQDVNDYFAWIAGGYEGKPPGVILGGAQDVPSGESVLVTIDLHPDVQYSLLDLAFNASATFQAS